MKGALLAEYRKIATTKLWWILLLCVVVLGGGYALVPAFVAVLSPELGGGGAAALRDPGTVRSIYNGGNTLTRILALVAGVMAMGSEYRHKTMAVTFLATPRRMRVVIAKSATIFGLGLLYGVGNLLGGIAVAVPFVLVKDGEFFLDDAATWRSMLLGIVSIALWTMIGMGIGILIRNLVIAMLVGIGFVYLVEPSLTAVFFILTTRSEQWALALNLMPSGATNSMLQITSPILFASPDPFTWWQGALVLAGWCLLPAILGWLFTLRRDV